MSEQTPESASNPTSADEFGAAGDEPSMEDILASIRKIIADDADPVPLDGPDLDDLPQLSDPETIAASQPATPAADEAVDIGALLSGLDITDPEQAPVDAMSAKMDTPAEVTAADTAFDLTDAMDLSELEADLSIPVPDLKPDVSVEADASDVEMPVTISDTPSEFEAQADDDMDEMMNALLADLEPATEEMTSSQTDSPILNPVAPEAEIVETSPAEITDPDLDLVKSLMADLTDEDEEPVTETVAAVEPPVTSESDLDALEGDILDSILDMTIEDEIAIPEPPAETAADAGPSLADIAAAAEADADAETAATEKALVAGETSADTANEAETRSETPTPTDNPQMETHMPRAVRSDAILDDVTEEATMSAFAQLNQVVEDKAILSERGPRIGDLVQDALKPMLKEWLDENLQAIVERAVAKEVKRLSSGK